MIKDNGNQLLICVFQNYYCLNPEETLGKLLEWNQTILELFFKMKQLLFQKVALVGFLSLAHLFTFIMLQNHYLKSLH